MTELAQDEEAAWARVEALIAARKPADYDAAVALLVDPRALAEREDRLHDFTRLCTALRHTHAHKPSIVTRSNRANL
ncbi:hypothetical protein JOF41_000080 [Saccharothrix coeruleofusca]|uniref:hypothetical protein n=1 Tax=Saccharothrix coeruleofusca TaxID=33919 RepID=UPI001AE597BA|nr:hypothetical protein [Saccharothrix coeruleofusca]MBP2333902.1 hypothetical protein [Saccharothrix coeruleofusca]